MKVYVQAGWRLLGLMVAIFAWSSGAQADVFKGCREGYTPRKDGRDLACDVGKDKKQKWLWCYPNQVAIFRGEGKGLKLACASDWDADCPHNHDKKIKKGTDRCKDKGFFGQSKPDSNVKCNDSSRDLVKDVADFFGDKTKDVCRKLEKAHGP
jgi:hypothetical protein